MIITNGMSINQTKIQSAVLIPKINLIDYWEIYYLLIFMNITES